MKLEKSKVEKFYTITMTETEIQTIIDLMCSVGNDLAHSLNSDESKICDELIKIIG